MSITLDGTNGIDSPDLNITGTGARITGDFSNGTIANRVMFQSSTVNGNTNISVIPNGTSTVGGYQAFNNSDPSNCSLLAVQAQAGDVRIQSTTSGAGSFLPMTFYTGGSETARIDTSGNFQFNSGYGSVATAYGCRAWVNFNGTGTVAIRASGNVTSITDNGTGDYTVNFTNAMPDVNYAGNVTAGANAVKLTVGAYQGTQTISAFRVGVTNFAGTNEDQSSMFVSVFR